MTRARPSILILLTLAMILAVGCGASSDAAVGTANDGIRLISVREGVDLVGNAPDGLVILDVRTPEEFAAGHLDGAVMIDLSRADFADRVAELDPDVPYLVYCRSGNRSAQAVAIMEELGFSDVADLDGGILSWLNAGLPTVAP